MPRIPRGQQAGFVYHVINRGNGRATIFHKPQDYFGLRLFQTFQKPALSSIEGFNRCAHQLRVPFQSFQSFQSFNRFAPFKALRRFNVQEFKPPFRSIQCVYPAERKSVETSSHPEGLSPFSVSGLLQLRTKHRERQRPVPDKFAGRNGRTHPANQLALFGLWLQT